MRPKLLNYSFVIFFVSCSAVFGNLNAQNDKLNSEVHIVEKFRTGNYREGLALALDSDFSESAVINYYVGKAYRYGEGIDSDLKKSMLYFEQASSLGNINAKLELIDIYSENKHLKSNIEKLSTLNKEVFSAIPDVLEDETGFYRYVSGKSFIENSTSNADIDKGISLLESSSKSGYVHAQYYLGQLYANGLKVSQDMGQAYKYFKFAAENGDPESQYIYGSFYLTGTETKKDIAKAELWYRKAAESNHMAAQYELGVLYLKGEELEQDIEQALKFFIQARNSGHTGLDNLIEKLTSVINPNG